jgi:4-aminobutyrate aminotransferase-like enzyme
MSRVYFTNSGSAAVETAIKLTGKEIAVCGKHSYHGSTILSANASDQDINKFWGIQNPMSVHKFEDVEDLIDDTFDYFVEDAEVEEDESEEYEDEDDVEEDEEYEEYEEEEEDLDAHDG